MASRRIEDLTPKMQELAKAFAAKMAEDGIPFMFTCTMRTQAEQDALYEQGRTKPGPIVTWTRKSNHVGRIIAGGLARSVSRAFDIAILHDGKPIWDTKIDVNQNHLGDYAEAGGIGESVGLRWGGRFKTPDMPHFEDPEC